MSWITTHVLDISLGRPAAGIRVSLDFSENGKWINAGKGITDADGRIKTLLANDYQHQQGIYRLQFETKGYFDSRAIQTFYPGITIEFIVSEKMHYHVPVLLSPFGYSTYRGS